MKITSKSILSPSHHTREPSQISVSSSLNRRLKSNGSMKGGHASPMFPTNGKKKGFENPEPSSPKVTCIGQVRVKTKKQGKKFRACRSKRRGEVSFRKLDHNNNRGSTSGIDSSIHLLRSTSHHHNQQQECKRWVHFPVTICEALRGFGSEFNCFLPCRSSCMANQRDNAKEREIELVVGGEDDGEKRESSSEMIMMMRSSQRRRVFEDIEIYDFCNKKVSDDDDEEKGKEGEGRVSICIPPKNALLLMRCRSDPVKMAALANKFWENPLQQDEQEQEAANRSEEKAVQEDAVEEGKYENQEVSEVSEMFVSCEEQEIPEAEPETEAESVLVSDETKVIEEESLGECLKEEMVLEYQEQDQEETFPLVSFDLDKVQVEENVSENEELQQGDEAEADDETENVKEEEEEGEDYQAVEEEEEEEVEEEEEEEEEEGEDYEAVVEEEEGEDYEAVVEEEEGEDYEAVVEEEEARGRSELSEPDPDELECESEEKLLPDCLLLMMGEPKLSMEVSKETWVCSTDFIRCVPEKKKNLLQQVKEKDGPDQPKPRISIDRNPPAAAPILLQPRRSSCSFPIAPPMATVVAAAARGAGGGCGKLVGGKGYEQFVLVRCKSEPKRSAAKLAPDTCFWKNRKLEPVGVGAAGVGF